MRAIAPQLFAFLSGVAALIFEALWFRQAGLVFGNSIWASALVLSSFMAGMALGNAWGVRLGGRLALPWRGYAFLELAIGLAGFLLVVGLPHLTQVLAPWLGPLRDTPWLLQLLRFALAFLLLMLPAVAMGATLPVLVTAAGPRAAEFGRTLGLVYGWNTLGAVVGAAASELVLIGALGLRATGAVAGVFNLSAALLALGWGRAPSAPAPAPMPTPTGVASRGPILLASFLSGGILLALEVCWFRLVSLYVTTTSLAFALMLAVVLAGIGLGSLLGSAWLRRDEDAHRHAWVVALAGGAAATLSYIGLGAVLPETVAGKFPSPVRVLLLSGVLMFPTSLLSGLIFSLLGQRLHAGVPGAARATGLLTLANTLGSMLGPILASFVLLPGPGVEASLFGLAGAYGLVALGAYRGPRPTAARAGAWGVAAVCVAVWLAFPHGRLRDDYLARVSRLYERAGEEIIAFREGSLETLQYARRSWLGEPVSYRLITDGYSMSSTDLWGQRYMALFAWLPAALHPELRSALLISFGVGTTARSLTDLPELERIAIVDISKDVLEMSEIVFPGEGESPVDDPRVTVHIEDGRHFLETSSEEFDLITAEPPPPALAGVVNLYTQEYFERLHDRLRPGGYATYWLPVMQLSPRASRSITAAFCAAFPNCSMWEGMPQEWILLGAREPVTPTTPERFRRLWKDPGLAPRLREIGVERPGQLLPLFLADAKQLSRWVGEEPALVDDRPGRAPESVQGWQQPPPEYAGLLLGPKRRARFEKSAWLAAVTPPEIREQSEPYLHWTQIITRQLITNRRGLSVPAVADALETTDLETLPLWLLGGEVARQRILAQRIEQHAEVSGPDRETMRYAQGLAALVEREYSGAAHHFAAIRADHPLRQDADLREVLALCLAGDVEGARRRARQIRAAHAPGSAPRFWGDLGERFGVGRER